MESDFEESDTSLSDDEVDDLAQPNQIVPDGESFVQGEIHQAQLGLLQSGENSDLRITCKKRVWRVHRAILAQRCAFFQGALRPEFQEESHGVIILDDDNPNAIEEMLRYLYTLSDQVKFPRLLKPSTGINDELPSEVKHLASILVTADKYCISRLIHLAGQKIQERLSKFQSEAQSLSAPKAVNLMSDLSDVLYKEDEVPALQQYQSSFAGKIFKVFGNSGDIPNIKALIQNHPKSGCDLLQSRDELVLKRSNVIETKNRTMRKMFEQVPKTRRIKISGWRRSKAVKKALGLAAEWDNGE